MKKVVVFTIIIIGLTSCMQLRRPDYTIKEAFQIGNTSSQDVTLHFYEDGKPKAVYAKIYNQSNPIYVSREDDREIIDLLMYDSILILKPRQTALFYAHYQGDHGFVVCLPNCGYNESSFSLFGNLKYFIGDSVSISTDGSAETPQPILNGELWETWYDEKEYIYYHFLRVE